MPRRTSVRRQFILFMCLTPTLRPSTLSQVTSFMRSAGFAAGQGAWTPQLHGLLHPAISEGGTSVRCVRPCSHWGSGETFNDSHHHSG